jgi:HAE1 family hydrophobic/amphiphilic exporter-1
MTITLPKGMKGDAVRPELQRKLDALKGLGKITVTAANNGGSNNDISVIVTSENSTDLRVGAQHIERLLTSNGGLTDINSNLGEQRKLLKVNVDLKKAAAQGFTQSEIGQAISNTLRGTNVGSVTLQGDLRDILVKVQASDASPADIASLELPVSQLQQQHAQTKASDKLTAKQKKASKKAEKEADKAAAKQVKELRSQRTKARKALADTRDGLATARKQLRQLKASPPKAPPPPDPTAPPVPVTTALLAQQQYAQQVQQYAQQVQQAAAQVGQLAATVKQTEKSITQLNDQLDSADEQASKTADQRKQSDKLQNEQEDLADVRAKPIQVKDVATVKQVLAPTTVTQIDGTESVTITGTPTGGDLGALTKAIQQRLDTDQNMPAGVSATLGGSAQDQQDAFRQLGLAMLVAIALVFIIMVATFRSLLQPLILMVSIPFAATGAIVALLLTDVPLGVPSMVGLLMLIGIVVTNAIVLIDLINQYRDRGEDLHSAVVDGARLRLRPIIMTACATIFALIPMGLGLTGGGAFISRPLAIVVIGGLVSSTVLTLLLVPVLYSLIERRSERRRIRARASETTLEAAPTP